MNVYERFTRTVAAVTWVDSVDDRPVVTTISAVTVNPNGSGVVCGVEITPTKRDDDGVPRKFRAHGTEYVGPFTAEIHVESGGRVHVWTDEEFPILEIFPDTDPPEITAAAVAAYVHAVYSVKTGRYRWKSAETWAADPAYIAADHVVRYDPETDTVRPRP